jgi:hypothetical protein
VAQKIKIAKTILNTKRNAGDTTILEFKLYYRTLVTKSA